MYHRRHQSTHFFTLLILSHGDPPKKHNKIITKAKHSMREIFTSLFFVIVQNFSVSDLKHDGIDLHYLRKPWFDQVFVSWMISLTRFEFKDLLSAGTIPILKAFQIPSRANLSHIRSLSQISAANPIVKKQWFLVVLYCTFTPASVSWVLRCKELSFCPLFLLNQSDIGVTQKVYSMKENRQMYWWRKPRCFN